MKKQLCAAAVTLSMLFGLMPNAVWAEGTDTSDKNEAKTYNFGMNISANEDPTEEIAEQEADSAVVRSHDEGDMSITLEETYEYEDWDEAGILEEEDVDYAVDGEGNYTIYTAAGLARVAYLTNNGFEQFLGKTVTLANDIDLTDAGVKGYSRDTVDETSSWNPIGSFKYTAATDSVDIKPFMGVFDGAGHKIKNLYMNVDEENTGLFGTVFTDMTIGGEQAVIRDVIIEGADIKCGFMANSFLVGFLSETIITGCIVDETSVMTIKGNAQMNGGIVGGAQTSGLNLGGEIYIEDCVNNGTISGGMLTGGIAGATGQRIINCKNNGAISGNFEIGGIVGYYQEEGGIAPFELTDCVNNGSVSAEDGWAGGIIGNTFISSETSLIARCYNTAEISASSMLGGIAGETTNANIENCYNTGKISGNNNANYAGGISGYFEATSSVSNCYNAGDIVNTKADKTGGIIGMNKEMAQNCFYLENTAEPETGGSVMITNEELADQTTFTDAGWDFEAVWTMSAELGRPVLQSVPEEYVPGAEQTPYLIHNEQELKEFRDNVNSGNTGIYARLVADIVLNDGIDMSELAADADGNVTYKGGAVRGELELWEPIGSSANKYTGCFDGDGYTISGLYINTASNNQGLFGYIGVGGEVKNLSVSDSFILGGSYVGAIAGRGLRCSLENVSVSALEGTWTWKNDREMTETGTFEETVIFTPSDTNYAPVEISGISVTVYKPATGGSGGGGGGGVASYTVKFDTQGGGEISSLSVTSGNTIEKPSDPERDGYTFAGWYTDKECTAEFDFETKITKSITLYAKWTEADEPEQTAEPEITPEPSQEWENPFTDVSENDWFYESVKYAAETGLFSGMTDTTFEPDTAITRAMLVTVLWRSEGEPVVNYAMMFSDVDQGAYYGEAVRWAAAEGIVKGYDEKTFAPNDLITREQIAAILERFADYYGMTTDETADIGEFADASEVSEWAYENVQWAVGAGIIGGRTDGTLDPLGGATRAETAAMLQRLFEG